MAENQELIYNVTGQTLVYDAPFAASSVTSCTIYSMGTGDDGTSENPSGWSSPGLETATTTTDAAAGLGQTNPRTIPVAATTNFEKGRTYQIVGAANESEEFVVAEISSGVSLTSAAPLSHAYVSSNTVQTTRLEQSVLTSWIQDSNNISDDPDPNPSWRVRWVYVATPPGGSSRTYAVDTYFDVVRYPSHDMGGVTAVHMDDYMPGWLDMLPDNHEEDQGSRIIAEAYHEVRWDMHAAGIADEMVRNSEAIERLTKPRAALALVMAIKDSEDPIIGIYHTEYHARLQGLLTVTNKTTMAVDSSGSGRRVASGNLWRF